MQSHTLSGWCLFYSMVSFEVCGVKYCKLFLLFFLPTLGVAVYSIYCIQVLYMCINKPLDVR